MSLQTRGETRHRAQSRAGNWQLRISERRAILLVLDLALVNASVLIGLVIWRLGDAQPITADWVLGRAYWFPLLSLLWLLSAALTSFYDPQATAHARQTIKALVELTGVLLVAYLLFYFLSSPGSLPRLFVLYFIAVSFGLLGLWRFVYTVYLGSSPFQRRAVIADTGNSRGGIASVIKEAANPHYQIVGSVANDANGREPVKDLPDLGTLADLPRVVQEMAVSEVIVTSGTHLDEALVRTLIDCQEQGVQITPLPSLYEELTGRVPLDMVADGWLGVLPLQHAGTGVILPLFKRSVDIALATLGLVVLALILPFLAVAIRIESSGPVFYVQSRVGKGGRVFRTYKLRSMRVDAERDGKAVPATPRDPRATRVGRLLRRTHIDELPQLLNVIKGDMSAVGPRPARPEEAAEFEEAIPFYRLRHSVRPGMAGWALIKQGAISDVEQAKVRLEYDLYYVKHQSIWLDLVVLLKTFVDAVTFRGR